MDQDRVNVLLVRQAHLQIKKDSRDVWTVLSIHSKTDRMQLAVSPVLSLTILQVRLVNLCAWVAQVVLLVTLLVAVILVLRALPILSNISVNVLYVLLAPSRHLVKPCVPLVVRRVLPLSLVVPLVLLVIPTPRVMSLVLNVYVIQATIYLAIKQVLPSMSVLLVLLAPIVKTLATLGTTWKRKVDGGEAPMSHYHSTDAPLEHSVKEGKQMVLLHSMKMMRAIPLLPRLNVLPTDALLCVVNVVLVTLQTL